MSIPIPSPSPLITLPVRDLVYRVAKATVGAIEVGVNGGPYVERVQRSTGNKKGDAWCASYTTDVGVCGLGEFWPVLKSGRVSTISAWAKTKGVRFLPSVEIEPMDLVLMWFPSLNRHAHIYFATESLGKRKVATIEGNTSDPLSRDPERDREGWLVAEKERVLGPKDRVVKWTHLLQIPPEYRGDPRRG